MTNRIKAIHAYRPAIKLGKCATTGDLVTFISAHSELDETIIRQVLREQRDALAFHTLRGEPVQIEGLGTYTPTLKLSGEIAIAYRTDSLLKERLNAYNAFKGQIERRENIGKSSYELVSEWNTAHPDDPVS